MSSNHAPTGPAGQPSTAGAGTAADLSAHLDRIEGQKATLARELSRCHEQLNLMLELSEHISSLHDPEPIQAALLRRWGRMLGARAVFMDRAGCCMRIELEPAEKLPIDVTPDRLRGVLAAHIETVRRRRRALVPPLTVPETSQLMGASVLLGTLPRADTETGVVVALRAAEMPLFEAADLLAAESVLAYGAQVLNSVLTVRHLQRSAVETVCTLVNAIDAKDNYTSAHSERVGGLARLTGEALELPKDRLQALEWAGLLHDVGKIGVPEHILNKPGALTSAEFDEMKKHSRTGFEVLKPVAQFAPVLDAVLYHHENHDGLGYPEGLRGEQIPLDARIIHVVDIFDALTTTRPYRTRYDFEQAIHILEAGAGRATDPHVTRLFIKALRAYIAEKPAEVRAQFGHLADGDAALRTEIAPEGSSASAGHFVAS